MNIDSSFAHGTKFFSFGYLLTVVFFHYNIFQPYLVGMKHVSLISQLSGQGDCGAALLPKLRQLATMLLNSRAPISVALNTTAQAEERLTAEAARFLGSFYGGQAVPQVPAGSGRGGRSFVQPADEKLHHVVSFPINFTAMSVPTVPFAHHDYAPLRYKRNYLMTPFAAG